MALEWIYHLFSEPTFWWVAAGVMLLSGASAWVGTFLLLSRKTLSGDVVAHSVLPGICLSFLFLETKNPIGLLLGALITGYLALWLITKLSRNSRLKEDTSTAIVLSVFFGAGIWLLTIIQKGGLASQTGLDKYLFGQAASLTPEDLVPFMVMAGVILMVIILAFKELYLVCFDPNFGKALGLRVIFFQNLISFLTVIAVVTGLQTVGVVLTAAMLITPAAAARYYTESVKNMLWLATLFGVLAGLAGALISYSGSGIPTGPVMVLVLTGFAMLSFFLAPKRGVLSKNLRQRNLKFQMLEENILKAFYHLAEQSGEIHKPFSILELTSKRALDGYQWQIGLKRMLRKGWVNKQKESYYLSDTGVLRAKRVVKLHRLWEVYLNTQLNLPETQVHRSAENMEHWISPELEATLECILNFPGEDVHGKRIPY